jgi:hypothetical protein
MPIKRSNINVHVRSGKIEQIYPLAISERDLERAEACGEELKEVDVEILAEYAVRSGRVVPYSILEKAEWDIRRDGIPFCWKDGNPKRILPGKS